MQKILNNLQNNYTKKHPNSKKITYICQKYRLNIKYKKKYVSNLKMYQLDFVLIYLTSSNNNSYRSGISI